MSLPTSTNDVTARKLSSVIDGLWTKIKNTFQTISNKVTSWSSTPSDTKYPSEKLVKTALDAKATIYTISQPAEYKSFLCITDITRWYDETGTQSLSAGYQMVGQWNCWRSGGGYDTVDCFFMLYHLNYRWQLNNSSCFELATTRPGDKSRLVAYPAILKDERDSSNVKYYFGFKIIPAWNNTFQFIGRVRDINFDNLIWIDGVGNSTTLPTGCTLIATPTEMKWDVDRANTLKTARSIQTDLASATAASFDGSADVTPGVTGVLPMAHGGTGVTSVTSSNFLVGNGTSAMVEKTPAQVLSLIGAQAAMTEMTTQEVTDFLTELGDF